MNLVEVRGFPSPEGPLDLDVQPGEVVLLRGPNGSGKTSLLRALAGLDAPLVPRSVRVQGRDPRALPARELLPLVALATQDPRDALVGLLVAGEFRLRGRTTPTTLAPLAKRDVATLSSGEARRVSLRVNESSDAPLLLLDEPVEGLDRDGRAMLLALVGRVRARGGAVVLADHGRALEGAATRTVHLGPPAAAPQDRPGMSRASAAPILVAPPALVRRGDSRVQLPHVELPPGLHALVGPNGAGKSTLLLRLAGLLDDADVRVAGAPPSPGGNVALLPARARDVLLDASVRDELAACEPWVRERLVPDALLDRHPLALSGGETQRVALARTLGTPRPVVLLDEPEAHLDADGRAVLLGVLARRLDEGACILVATHDDALLAQVDSSVQVGAAP